MRDGSLYAGDIEEAFRRVSWRPPQNWRYLPLEERARESVRYVIENTAGEMALLDVPQDFATRQFDLRRVQHRSLKAADLRVCSPEETPCIYRD